MGKGDVKTKRGKIFNHSFGVRRPSKEVIKRNEKEKKSEK